MSTKATGTTEKLGPRRSKRPAGGRPETPEFRALLDELHRSIDRAEAAIDAADRKITAYLEGSSA